MTHDYQQDGMLKSAYSEASYECVLCENTLTIFIWPFDGVSENGKKGENKNANRTTERPNEMYE